MIPKTAVVKVYCRQTCLMPDILRTSTHMYNQHQPTRQSRISYAANDKHIQCPGNCTPVVNYVIKLLYLNQTVQKIILRVLLISENVAKVKKNWQTH